MYLLPKHIKCHRKIKYINDLLGDENGPENNYLSDSDDDEYFSEDRFPISDTEEATGNLLLFGVLNFITYNSNTFIVIQSIF